ncbi:hypothetical protein ACQ4LE_005533, partial [Meloidogyne hapla]
MNTASIIKAINIPNFNFYGRLSSLVYSKHRVYEILNGFSSSSNQKLTKNVKSEARAVVVGGGIVGLSTLYHLAKKGWSDVVLLERKELTSGSTWHAAGLLPIFNINYTVGQIHKYSVEMYQRLEKETGVDIGFRQCTNLRVACTNDRWDEYMYYKGIADTINVPVNILTKEQVHKLWPICKIDGILGAIQHPDDGYLQPANLAQAFAKGSRDLGATIYTQTPVINIEPFYVGNSNKNKWLIKTNRGNIITDHVITATGSFARKTAKMMGIELPVLPVEHHYLVTEQHPILLERKKQGLPELSIFRESDNSWYIREENGGFIVGIYEKGAPVCYWDGQSEESEFELFQPNMERIMLHIEKAIERIPAFGEVGIKTIYNGAIPFTPDAIPIVGPAPGLHNYWLSEGHSFGITAAGGAGWQLAEWIVNGEPSIDMTSLDPRRFGDYASEEWIRLKNEEAYENIFTIHYPDEERSAGRPLLTSPCYERMANLGAVFGSICGWERPNWFIPSKTYKLPKENLGIGEGFLLNQNWSNPLEKNGPIVEKWSFRHSNYFKHVGNEVLNVNKNVGLMDNSYYAKLIVKGQNARKWLNSIFTKILPQEKGKIQQCFLLNKNGCVIAEFTVYEYIDDCFYLISSGPYNVYVYDLLRRLLPGDGSLQIFDCTKEWGIFMLAGPNSSKILEKLSPQINFSEKSFPLNFGSKLCLGHCWVEVLHTNYFGEIGWELHHPMLMQNTLFDLIFHAGAEFGIKPLGVYAANSMAVENSYRQIKRELTSDYNLWECGLHSHVDLKDNRDFPGRNSLINSKDKERWKFITLEVNGLENVDARGGEPIFDEIGQKIIGRATNGAFGWRIGKSLALAMVNPNFAEEGTCLTIKILGKLYSAISINENPFKTNF